MAEKVHAGMIYHYGNRRSGEKLIRHFPRVVVVHEKRNWRPPRNPVPLPDWVKVAVWTLWEGDALVDGKRVPVIGVSPTDDPPAWFAYSVDHWLVKELALQPWIDEDWDKKRHRRRRSFPTCSECQHWLRNEGFPNLYGKCDRPFVPTILNFPLWLVGERTHETFGCPGFEDGIQEAQNG